MPYDNIISRTDLPMPEEVSNAFLGGLESESAVLTQFTRVPVGGAQTKFPVLSALPLAYWVNGDTGVKQTTEVNWDDKFLNIEELAVIVPIPENVIDDAGFPIWAQVQPLCEQAGGRLLDATVFFGVNAPASFPDDVVTSAVAAGNVVARGANDAAEGGIAQDLSDLLGTIESDGYGVDSGIAARSLRGRVRGARNTTGERLGGVAITKESFEVDGVTYATTSMPGLWPTGVSAAEAIAFDPTQFVVGVRQDFTWKLLDQAVIQDAAGEIIYNLAQQDMVAMRMKMRVGWQVANTINYDQAVEANRYPAGVLRSPAA